MSKRSKARARAYERKQALAAARAHKPAPPALVVVTGTRKVWVSPVVRELDGNTAIIRRAYARFESDHPLKRMADDDTNLIRVYRSGHASTFTPGPPLATQAR